MKGFMTFKRFWVFFAILVLSINSEASRHWPPTPEMQSYAIIGDAGEWNSSSRSVRDSIYRSGVDNLILPGDNLYSRRTSYEEVWNHWYTLGFLFPIVAIGNHNDGYENEIQFFHMPAENYSRVHGKDVRFIVLNSDNEETVHQQISWVRGVLQDAREKLVFLVYHHPSFTLSPQHGWKERKAFQLGMHKVIKEFRQKITAVINGHDHIASLAHFDDLPVLISGATHDVRRPVKIDNLQEGVHVRTAWLNEPQPYWIRLDLHQSSDRGPEAIAHFVRAADDRISCTAHLDAGREAKMERNCSKQISN